MDVFRRATYGQLWLTLASDEVLGQLDTSYLEDYNGTPGQVSLFSLADSSRTPVLMTEATVEPAPHEVFSGWLPLNTLADGIYQIEGRVRDVLGNVTILSDYAHPDGTERVLPLAFQIVPGGTTGATVIGPLTIMGGLALRLSLGGEPVDLTLPTAPGVALQGGALPGPASLHLALTIPTEVRLV